MDKELHETTNLGVERVKGKLGHLVQICFCRLT